MTAVGHRPTGVGSPSPAVDQAPTAVDPPNPATDTLRPPFMREKNVSFLQDSPGAGGYNRVVMEKERVGCEATDTQLPYDPRDTGHRSSPTTLFCCTAALFVHRHSIVRRSPHSALPMAPISCTDTAWASSLREGGGGEVPWTRPSIWVQARGPDGKTGRLSCDGRWFRRGGGMRSGRNAIAGAVEGLGMGVRPEGAWGFDGRRQRSASVRERDTPSQCAPHHIGDPRRQGPPSPDAEVFTTAFVGTETRSGRNAWKATEPDSKMAKGGVTPTQTPCKTIGALSRRARVVTWHNAVSWVTQRPQYAPQDRHQLETHTHSHALEASGERSGRSGVTW